MSAAGPLTLAAGALIATAAAALLVAAVVIARRDRIARNDESLARQAAEALLSGREDGQARTEPPLQARLSAAGVGIDATLFATLTAAGSALAALALLAFAGPAGAVAGIAAGPAAAWLYVRAKRKSREKLFDSQLSGALLMMSHSLEGGITLEAAIESVGRYVDEPLRSELVRVSSEMRYGVPFLASLENMSRRVRCKDMPLVIAAASVNAETGCDLAPVLAKISATIDGRIALRRHIAAITSGGKVQTIILAVLPIAVMGSLLVMAPDFYSSMLASPIGWAAIGVAAAMDIAGVALSRHLQKMKVD